MKFLRIYLGKVLPVSVILFLSFCPHLHAQSTNYTTNAISINDAGDVVQGNVNIQDMNERLGFENRELESIFETQANRNGTYVYEIGKFYDQQGQEFNYVAIRKAKEVDRPIELEFYARRSNFTSASESIDERRQEWIARCNAHDAAGLINELYAEKTMYYNHKPLIVGREGVIRDYQYMNREGYSLKLTPLKKEQVNDSIVLEIGQCSGSYGGKYVIVWKKNDAGKWEVLLDSNI